MDMPKILIMTSAVGGGHVFRDLAIAKELGKILPTGYEVIFASGGNAYEMLKEEGVQVELISTLDIPVHLGTANFFKFYFSMLWSEFLQMFDLRRLINKHKPALVVLDEYFFLTDYCRCRGIQLSSCVILSVCRTVPSLVILFDRLWKGSLIWHLPIG
jgi:UDP:flavonoid glycosyltransferase YjiC (YdhE family)